MRKVHANELHAKLGHPREDRMRAIAKHLHYIIRGTLEVGEDFYTAKRKHKSIHTVAEERDLKPGKIIYIYIGSQKKPSYGGSKNWVLIQGCDTKQEWSFFTNTEGNLSEKVTPFLKKMKTIKENVKMVCCDNAGKNNILEEICMKNFEEIKFEFTSPGTPQQNGVVDQGFDTFFSQNARDDDAHGTTLKHQDWHKAKCEETATKL